MTLIMRPRTAATTPSKLRGRKGVRNIIYQAPPMQRETLEWWLAFISARWGER